MRKGYSSKFLAFLVAKYDLSVNQPQMDKGFSLMFRFFSVWRVSLLVILLCSGASAAWAAPQYQTGDAPTPGCQWVYSTGGQSAFANLLKDHNGTPLSDLYFGDGFGAGSGMARIGYLDFDGDGTQDVFRTALRTDGLLQWQYAPDSRNEWVDLTYAAAPTSFRFGDFNGDGKSDVLAVYTNADGSQSWNYSASGTANFQTLKEISPGEVSRYSAPRVGDFNGDGVADIFVAEPRSDGAWQWKYAPDGYKPFVALTYAFAEPASLQFGDFNSDGFTDVFAALPRRMVVNSGSTRRAGQAILSPCRTSARRRRLNLRACNWATLTAMARPMSLW